MTNEEIIAMQFEEIELLRMQLRLQRTLEDEYKAEISILRSDLEELQRDYDEVSIELDSIKGRIVDMYDEDTRRPWED